MFSWWNGYQFDFYIPSLFEWTGKNVLSDWQFHRNILITFGMKNKKMFMGDSLSVALLLIYEDSSFFDDWQSHAYSSVTCKKITRKLNVDNTVEK